MSRAVRPSVSGSPFSQLQLHEKDNSTFVKSNQNITLPASASRSIFPQDRLLGALGASLSFEGVAAIAVRPHLLFFLPVPCALEALTVINLLV